MKDGDNKLILQYHKLYNKVISVSPCPYSILFRGDHSFDLIILWHVHNISKYSENSGRHNFHYISCFNAFPDWISSAPTWLIAILFLFFSTWFTSLKVRTVRGTTDCFRIGKGVCQGCILSPCWFNLYSEYIMRNSGLDEAQAGIKIARRKINTLYPDDTTLWQNVKKN